MLLYQFLFLLDKVWHRRVPKYERRVLHFFKIYLVHALVIFVFIKDLSSLLRGQSVRLWHLQLWVLLVLILVSLLPPLSELDRLLLEGLAIFLLFLKVGHSLPPLSHLLFLLFLLEVVDVNPGIRDVLIHFENGWEYLICPLV